MSADAAYISTSQQVLLAVIELLAAKPFEGVAPGQVARALPAYSGNQCFRALRNLERAGWAEKTQGGAWRLTPHVTTMSERVRLALADMHRAYLHGGDAVVEIRCGDRREEPK